MTSLAPLPNERPATGTVLSLPRMILQAEGGAVLLAAAVAYGHFDGNWIKFALLFLIPDIFMLGYLAGPHLGATIYNVGHSTLLPLILIASGLFGGMPALVGIGLIWLAHVGFDRLVGYGLKYSDAFQHTHLGTSFPAKRK